MSNRQRDKERSSQPAGTGSRTQEETLEEERYFWCQRAAP
jgi:hypothetical protein